MLKVYVNSSYRQGFVDQSLVIIMRRFNEELQVQLKTCETERLIKRLFLKIYQNILFLLCTYDVDLGQLGFAIDAHCN